MSIDIAIRQKGLFKKTLPLSVITGGNLKYGTFNGKYLEEGRSDTGELIVYDQAHLSRGISVIWNEQEKNQITLRALNPTSREEINALFDLVARIGEHWKCELEVDGMSQSLNAFLARREEMLSFNEKTIKTFSERVLSGEDSSMTLFCTMFPLTIGIPEAERFVDSPDAFYQWMHERQNIDAYYANPTFYKMDDGILGRYVLTEGVRSIFPNQPRVPFGLRDPETNRTLECSNYQIFFYSTTKDAVIGSVPYERFLAYLPGKTQPFDAENFLFEGLTLAEMEQILGS